MREATGWDLQVAGDLRRTPPPTDEELSALRELLEPLVRPAPVHSEIKRGLTPRDEHRGDDRADLRTGRRHAHQLRARAGRRPPSAGLSAVQVDRAATSHAAAHLPAPDDHRDHRPGARRRAGDRRPATPTSPASTRASRSASGSRSPVACSTPRASRCATRWSRCGRPTPAAATATAGTTGRRRWTPTSPAPAAA